MDTPGAFRPQPASSPMFPWNMNMDAYCPSQIPLSSPAQADPRGSTRMSDPFAHYADSESMPTKYTPYSSTWSQNNPSDYNHSQPRSEAFHQVYEMDENQFKQPYNHIGRAATFISTSQPQTGSLRSSGSLCPPQAMEPKSHNPHTTTSTTNSFEEDRVPSSGPSSTKKRRRQFSPERREKTKNVRRLGACIRCRIMRVGVSFSLPLFSRQSFLRYLSVMKKPLAVARAKGYSTKPGLTTSRATVII